MLKLGFRSLCCVVALTCAGASALSGCSNDGQEESVGKAGSISLGLATTGADGATYGFPANTYLYLTTASSGEVIALSGPEAVLQKTLPVGAYTATLLFQSGNVELTRTDGTVTTTVDADWTNPQPVTFEIVDGQTTPIALHFSVKGLVDLVFQTGTLQIVADVVEEQVDQPASALFEGTSNVYYLVNGDDTAAYATALAVDQGVDHTFSFGFNATGVWTQFGSSAVCQQGTLTLADSNNAGLDYRLEQVLGADGYLCVSEAGTTDLVSLYPSRYGAPPVGQESFLPDAAYSFYAGVSGYVGDIYDGTTLQQTALENATFSSMFLYHQVYDSASQQVTVLQGSGSGTLQVAP